MSGQDEKVAEIETAEAQYGDLVRLLESAKPEDPYSLLPPELSQAMLRYGGSGAIARSMEFRTALKTYWRGINVPSELKPDAEEIANRSIMDGWWRAGQERYKR